MSARHLTLVRGGAPAAPAAPPDRPRVQLTRSAELDLEAAAGFLLELDRETAGADLPRAMYLLGLAEGHLANMIEALRAVREVR